VSRRAKTFLIWRAGESVNWECTAQDIADELGMTIHTVRHICREKGWGLQKGESGLSQHNADRPSIDTLMEKPWLGIAGRT
jgi:hypothetical protein